MSKRKIYISVDMEGITGVIDWGETEGKSPDYQYFRKIMTEEVNAAIEGALEKGAVEIVVRDAHGFARNIIPDLLNENAKLLRAWASSPYSMMEGIDNSFDAAIFIGYHAKAMTAAGTLAHTMRGDILNVNMNGISLSEMGWNSLIAGHVDVPVIFISGDNLICDQAKEIIPGIETVAVKQGLGEANLNLHPNKSKLMIKQGVENALDRLDEFSPLKWETPYSLEISFKKTRLANRASWYPGAERVNDFTVSIQSENFLDCMKFFYFMH
ncbi:hypothetical protein B6I21_01515 [candidate division KSB1 bacterium 4572_119]|nr:MAG: hypothetical protein B6I21_01515 [candidate division KSB1 bacterium 4572_119]